MQLKNHISLLIITSIFISGCSLNDIESGISKVERAQNTVDRAASLYDGYANENKDPTTMPFSDSDLHDVNIDISRLQQENKMFRDDLDELTNVIKDLQDDIDDLRTDYKNLNTKDIKDTPPTAQAPTILQDEIVNVEVGKNPPLGNPNAKVVIVEFSDLQCPFCKRFHEDTFLEIVDNYVDNGQVVFYYRHFPLAFHENAESAAWAVNCAGEQGKYWDMIAKMFENQSDLSNEAILKYAKELKLDPENLSACMEDISKQKEVTLDSAAGTQYGVSGTPSFFVNGHKLVGAQPYSSFKEIIEAELSK
jgi:protein-disulfide isomerase